MITLHRPATRALVALACFVAAGCAGRPPAEEAAPAPLSEWRVDSAPHVGLWYHGLAYVSAEAPSVQGTPMAGRTLPLYHAGYVDSVVALKRRAGAYPTALDVEAARFADLFAADDAYATLHFLPLYFRDAIALFSAIRVWEEVGGDPRRVSSPRGAQAIAFLSKVFPRAEQRRTVAAWARVLKQEATAFYDAHWSERAPALEQRAAAVQREWALLAPALAPYLDYVGLEGGTMLLVPALGAEGRIVSGGPGPPRAAVLEPPPERPDAALWSFVHELVYPLVGDAVREYVAPARIRELGQDALEERAAVRGGALLLGRVAPDRVPRYRAFFLEWAGAPVGRDAEATDAALRKAFPLPTDLERGLEETIERALAGI